MAMLDNHMVPLRTNGVPSLFSAIIRRCDGKFSGSTVPKILHRSQNSDLWQRSKVLGWHETCWNRSKIFWYRFPGLAPVCKNNVWKTNCIRDRNIAFSNVLQLKRNFLKSPTGNPSRRKWNINPANLTLGFPKPIKPHFRLRIQDTAVSQKLEQKRSPKYIPVISTMVLNL
jgi:hypothetical protein